MLPFSDELSEVFHLKVFAPYFWYNVSMAV